MSNLYLGGIEDPLLCPGPPYNATNFTPANSTIYNALINNALTQPQYPLPTGSDAQQIYRNTQNISFFTTLNQQTQAVKSLNVNNVSSGRIPYPRFVSDAQRLMYIQGQTMTAARNNFTGQNPSAPAGVPCSTIYGIIAVPPYTNQ